MPGATHRLGQTPIEIKPLGVGCWAWGDEEYWRYGHEYGASDVVDAFSASLEAGIDFFDTAEAYAWGKGEQILGALVRKSGARVRLATKYAPLAGRGGAAAVAKGIAGSLRRLGVASIDLYQIHWADRKEAPIGPVMDVLAEAFASGRIGAVGVSNYSATEMREAHAALAKHGIPLASNQVRYSLLYRAAEVDGVLETCRELGISLLAYSPLEQGLLSGKYSAANPPLGKRADTPWFAAENLEAAEPVVAALRDVAARLDCTPAAVALAWLMRQDGVVPIAGARNRQQAVANAAALDLALTQADVDRLDAESRRWRVAQ